LPTASSLAAVTLSLLVASGLAACSTDGTTASCHTENGEELPLYDIDDVDLDSGLHPDAEVNAIRDELIDKRCLTALGYAASSVPDSGSD
jgi:hypothetical protein